MAFHIGQKVTMKRAHNWDCDVGDTVPVFGNVYTIGAFEHRSRELSFLLEECLNAPGWWVAADGKLAYGERAFPARYFRPVVSKSTEAGMKQLRSLLTDAPEKVEA